MITIELIQYRYIVGNASRLIPHHCFPLSDIVHCRFVADVDRASLKDTSSRGSTQVSGRSTRWPSNRLCVRRFTSLVALG